MSKKIAAGLVGGLIGGLGFDAVMRALSMIAFGATAVHAADPAVGWLVYPVYGIAIGACFGWLLHGQTLDDVRAALVGGLYGLGWWIIAEVILMSTSAIDRARDVALPLLVGHVVYGVILGVVWSQITNRISKDREPGAVDYAPRRAA